MTENKRITDPDEIRRRISEYGRWWHEIELAPGIVTPGDDSNRQKLPVLDELGLPADLSNVRALDIGCSDGFFSFELENRGAQVVAMDFVPADYTGFAVAREVLGSSVQYRMDNVYNLSPESYGTFDVVFFLGVLYHLRKPLAALDSIRSVMKPGGELYLVTFMIDEHVVLPDGSVTSLAELNPTLCDIPLWQSYPGDVLNGDFTNCFAPNMCALKAAMSDAQFSVESAISLPGGGYVRATASENELAAKYRKLDGRLQETPFDPSVPYYLDEEGSEHTLTGRRIDNVEGSSDKQNINTVSSKPSWWSKLKGSGA